MGLDYGGIATLIGACAGAIISVGTFVMQLMNWRDSRRHKELLNDIQNKVTTIKAENEA